MLKSKLFQKYLASVVCCLVLVMAISTLLLAYSFHIHRSPLLVKALGFGERLESPSHENIIQHSKQSHISTNRMPIDDRFTTSLNKPENELHVSTEINGFGIKSEKLGIITNSEKPGSAIENIANTDTIYIDDFERGKSNHHLSEENDLKIDSTNNADMIEKSVEKIETADLEFSKQQTKAFNKTRKNKKRKNKQNGKDKIATNFEIAENAFVKTEESVANKKIETNLDALYDSQRNSYKIEASSTEKLNDDTEDDLSARGSGSGDFPITDDTEVEQFPYDNFVVQHFSADWIDDENRLVRTPFSQKLKPDGSMLRQAQKRYKSNEKKTTLLKSENKPQINNKKMFEMSTPDRLHHQRNEAFKNLDTENTQSIRKKPKKAKKNRKVHVDTLHENTQKPFKPIEKLMRGQNNVPVDLISSSETWLETRTRRIMGNVKKSEERSRQLLLCEEAGGGELCRMLFKGHISE